MTSARPGEADPAAAAGIARALPAKFSLHERGSGEADPAHQQPEVFRLNGPWNAASLAEAFRDHRTAWYELDLQPYADNIAAVLAHERALSEQWQGLPGTDHPAHWHDGSAAARATPQARAADRLAVWHPPLAWMMPVIRRRARDLVVRLPLAEDAAALERMMLSAVPAAWRGAKVRVRIDIETRVYWGARAAQVDGQHVWAPCRRRGDGLSRSLDLLTLEHGRAAPDTLDGQDLAPELRRHLSGGVGLLVAVPVVSFERASRWRSRLSDWWVAVWRRIGWFRRGDRDPTFVHRLEVDEPLWNAAVGSSPLSPGDWKRALRDGALLRPASGPARRWKEGTRTKGSRHVVLVHGGLSSARGGFEALLTTTGGLGLSAGVGVWPGLPDLDEACTWRFEHDTFVPVVHNIDRLAKWLDREGVCQGEDATVVLLAHSRGGNVVRFALPVLRKRFPRCRFSAITAGSPHLGTQVFSRIGRRWTGLAMVVGAVRQMTQGWLGREQLAQLVLLERGLAYEVPPGFHDVEPEGVQRMSRGRPEDLPEGLWLWGSEWGLGDGHHRVEDALWDWLVEDLGGAEVGGDGLVARHSALGGRDSSHEGAHDASPVFHTRYFAHPPTVEQIAQRLRSLLR